MFSDIGYSSAEVHLNYIYKSRSGITENTLPVHHKHQFINDV